MLVHGLHSALSPHALRVDVDGRGGPGGGGSWLVADVDDAPTEATALPLAAEALDELANAWLHQVLLHACDGASASEARCAAHCALELLMMPTLAPWRPAAALQLIEARVCADSRPNRALHVSCRRSRARRCFCRARTLNPRLDTSAGGVPTILARA